jgi:hypothetical protein
LYQTHGHLFLLAVPLHHLFFLHAPAVEYPRHLSLAESPAVYDVLPRLRLSRRRSNVVVRHCMYNRISNITFSWINSSFFASRSSLGTPWAFDWALRQSDHSSLQNLAVSFSRKPVSWICSFLISGCESVSSRM